MKGRIGSFMFFPGYRTRCLHKRQKSQDLDSGSPWKRLDTAAPKSWNTGLEIMNHDLYAPTSLNGNLTNCVSVGVSCVTCNIYLLSESHLSLPTSPCDPPGDALPHFMRPVHEIDATSILEVYKQNKARGYINLREEGGERKVAGNQA